MKNKLKNKIVIATLVLCLLTSMGGVVFAVSGNSASPAGESVEHETPITGDALAKASQAALAHTGGGRVTETEVGDEESYYEVEVTLANGNQVDVQLDEKFNVVGDKVEVGGESETN